MDVYDLFWLNPVGGDWSLCNFEVIFENDIDQVLAQIIGDIDRGWLKNNKNLSNLLLSDIYYMCQDYPHLLEKCEKAITEGIYKFNKKPNTRNTTKMKCMICLEHFSNKPVVFGKNCNHPTHEECLKKWLKKQNSCPYCRKHVY